MAIFHSKLAIIYFMQHKQVPGFVTGRKIDQ